jgi:hypothetical protein
MTASNTAARITGKRRGRRMLFLVGLGVAAAGIAAIGAGLRVQLTRRRLAERAASRSDHTAPPTRSELYREAQRLGVRGRSKMTKAQLMAAVAEGSRA